MSTLNSVPGFASNQTAYGVRGSVANQATAGVRTVGDPNAQYLSLFNIWARNRAICGGERHCKDYDELLDSVGYTNLLIPFSPTMSTQQYSFYKAEAELPGIVGQFSTTLVGALLRKEPTLRLPDTVPEDATEWIMKNFGKDGSTLTAFLDEALWEEIQTSRAWIFIDYPLVSEQEDLDQDLSPYPVLYSAEHIINWRTTTNDTTGRTTLSQVVVAGFTEEYDEDKYEFHPRLVDTRWVHELNVEGDYQVRVFKAQSDSSVVNVVQGEQRVSTLNQKPVFTLDNTIMPLRNGSPIDCVPAWPMNGLIEPRTPMLTRIIDKEVALYNKISRRNHLLYGAATYTPVISSTMSDTAFDDIVNGGLGTWIHLPNPEDRATVLQTPTEALQDMDRSISSGYEEIAQMGVRMVAPESSASGVALQLRNATQSIQLASLNTKISSIMTEIICFMVNWQYELELGSSDISFELCSDFNGIPQGADWLTLATTWYQQGLFLVVFGYLFLSKMTCYLLIMTMLMVRRKLIPIM